jgi:hypothetical protein
MRLLAEILELPAESEELASVSAGIFDPKKCNLF